MCMDLFSAYLVVLVTFCQSTLAFIVQNLGEFMGLKGTNFVTVWLVVAALQYLFAKSIVN